MGSSEARKVEREEGADGADMVAALYTISYHISRELEQR